MHRRLRGAAELARQLAVSISPVRDEVVSTVKAGEGDGWILLLVPCQVEATCSRATLDGLAALLKNFRTLGYRIVVLTSNPLPPLLSEIVDVTRDLGPEAAARMPADAFDRLAENAVIRTAGVTTGQAIRPRLVIQLSGPFLDAGADVSYYCGIPLVLCWAKDMGRHGLRFSRNPLARVEQVMERTAVSRAAAIACFDQDHRESILRAGAWDARVVIVSEATRSSGVGSGAEQILECLARSAGHPAQRTSARGASLDEINGHRKRVTWIAEHLDRDDKVVDFGCGTGVMLSIPLIEAGYDVRGLDVDRESIDLGRKLLRERGLDASRLVVGDLADLLERPDVIIASEVLEHIPDPDLDDVLDMLSGTLRPNGRLLVTVPNGYGWFELESVLWYRFRLGALLDQLRVLRVVMGVKRLFGVPPSNNLPSTLAESPHVQRFTKSSIVRRLQDHGFRVDEVDGSVLMCGPFTGIFMEGSKSFARLNARAGSAVPRLAASFFVACTRQDLTGASR